MSRPRVLVSGASVAGPAIAYWLVRAGCRVTIVERAPSLRSAGQGIDVRDAARDVIKRMGIFDRIRDRSSHEEGMEFVDSNNRCYARFGVDKSGKGDSMTSDIEILRGELAGILFDVTKDNISYIFGDMVESMEEIDKEVNVHFSNGTLTTAFDLVVAADGMGSKIRDLALGDASAHFKSLNFCVAYFSIPPSDTDTMWSTVYWFQGGRNIMLRPDNVGRTRAFLSLTAYDKSDESLLRLKQASKKGISVQKALVQELFEDAGWEISRILKGMHESSDFYMQDIGQVRLDRWSSGRVNVVGDAGYAPSPYTGMGTSLALIGAYVLAGEIFRQPNNIPAALASYERLLRPYVETVQKLSPGIPWIGHPQSKLGVRMLESVVWGVSVLSAAGIGASFSKIAAFLSRGEEPFKLPDYEAFKAVA